MACCGSSRHIVALEENKDIFNAIFKSMRKLTPVVVATLPPPVVVISQDLDDMPMQPQKFALKGKFNK